MHQKFPHKLDLLFPYVMIKQFLVIVLHFIASKVLLKYSFKDSNYVRQSFLFRVAMALRGLFYPACLARAVFWLAFVVAIFMDNQNREKKAQPKSGTCKACWMKIVCGATSTGEKNLKGRKYRHFLSLQIFLPHRGHTAD